MVRVIELRDLAYLAGVIDTHATVRTRTLSNDTVLPMVAINCPNLPLLTYLSELTATKVISTRREYSKAGCVEHCPEKHQHIVSASGRWSLTGVKATVLLCAVHPYLRLQRYDTDQAIEVGLRAPHKPATLTKMLALGWPDPWAAAYSSLDLPNRDCITVEGITDPERWAHG